MAVEPFGRDIGRVQPETVGVGNTFGDENRLEIGRLSREREMRNRTGPA